MHGGDVSAWGWAAMVVMMVVMSLIWIGVPALIAWAAWVASRRGPERASPLGLLEETYARGQITREQFEQTKKDLS